MSANPGDPATSSITLLEILFHTASGLSGAEREAFLERETAGDAELREQLRDLLRHSDGAEERIAAMVNSAVEQASGGLHWAGRYFGPYRIIREIGRGGMGLVFEAWRDDSEYHKRVALKVAPDWRDLERLRERFRNERQILARLEHPNIARFLDGGTEDGIPYFAMEYIDGKPVTAWARDSKSNVRERIILFRQICAAVSYAHENLIIHRDLKPANILVDGSKRPKLLDFGIATLLDSIAGETASTTGVRLWTPDYASPEQVRGGAITVRTDVYSLGLILYELLCDERAQMADASSPLALDRSICETDAPPPSARAAARGDRTLSRQLRGDLDRIVTMATRKEPSRRYASAAALDADLERFLDGRPVTARPNTVIYRMAKAIRRHSLISVAVLLVIVSLTGGIWSTLYQARRAERRFQQLRGLANAFVFDVHDQIQFLPGATDARKAIVTTALRYLENLRQDAGSDRGLLRELASAYLKVGDVQGNPFASSLGDSRGALQSYRQAESILTPLAGQGDRAANLQMVSVVYKLGTLQNETGSAEGIKQMERARLMARQLIAARPNDVEALRMGANISSDLARLASDRRAPQQSLESAQEAVALAQRTVHLDPSSPESRDYLAVAQNSLASAYRASGDLNRSAETYRAALESREQLVKDYPEVGTYRRSLLLTYGHLGDALGLPEGNGLGFLPEAVKQYEKATEIADWIVRRDPSDRVARFDLAMAHSRTASCLLETPNGSAAALAHLTRADSILSTLVKEDSSNQRYRFNLFVVDSYAGKSLMGLGRNAEAERRLEGVRSNASTFNGGPNEGNARAWSFMATLRLSMLKAKAGDKAAALSLANETAAGFQHGGSPRTAWGRGVFYRQLGLLYSQMGQRESAVEWFGQSAEVWRKMNVAPALKARREKALAEVEHDLNAMKRSDR